MRSGSTYHFTLIVSVTATLFCFCTEGFSQAERTFLFRETSSGALDRLEQKQLIEFAHALDQDMRISFDGDLLKLRSTTDVDPGQLLAELNNSGIGVFESVQPATSREALRSTAIPAPTSANEGRNGP